MNASSGPDISAWHRLSGAWASSSTEPPATQARLTEVAQTCMQADRADALLFGCMTMSFLNMADEIGARVGVPVVNAGKAARKQAGIPVSMGMARSRKAWPTPARMKAGATVSDMRHA